MKTIKLDSASKLDIPNLTLAAGFFDGMHLAHQELLKVAKEKGHPNGLITLTEHIPSLIGNERYKVLTTLADKKEIAETYNLDYFIVLSVDKALINLSPEEFATKYLSTCKNLIVGFDYTFGKNGQGKPSLLEQMFPGRVTIVPEMLMDNQKIGSTRIRHLLETGDIVTANRLLGRPYRIKGKIVKGHGRGRLLGFPTANVDYGNYILPLGGVYATKTMIDKETFLSLTNIGNNPTFANPRVTLESHMFGFGRESYNEQATIDFLLYLRPEIRFASVEELKLQIANDEIELKKAIGSGRIK